MRPCARNDDNGPNGQDIRPLILLRFQSGPSIRKAPGPLRLESNQLWIRALTEIQVFWTSRKT